ncbi:MAG TPA: helix-turn-helix transcriptional regulator, partial [Planctomycetota bacterium]|nr:helix-turn-helix transcriptional regulator [Planctomycetota bacterium]
MSTEHSVPRFGKEVRGARQAKSISLRKFASAAGMSATYLSKVERGEFPPPSEDKIVAIARSLGHDSDILLAKAGKVSPDLPVIIRRH